MNLKLFKINFFLIILSFQIGNAQNSIVNDSLSIINTENKQFNYAPLIVPTALMTYGIVALNNNTLQNFDRNIRKEIVQNNYKGTSIDNFTTVAPTVAVYALNVAGVKSKNNFKDRSIVIGTSYLLVGASVFTLKEVTKIERPDQSSFDSFPSGHTAVAFASAEFLWQEYKDVSVWYGISGYFVAAGTGVLRMYNNRHWFSDVAMGAGIGILSTKVAYWLLPVINNHIFKTKNSNTTFMMAPFYNDKKLGMGFVLNL